MCEVLLYPNTSPSASLSQRLDQFLAYDYAFDIADDTQLDAISLSIGATHPLLKGGTLITTVVETIYAYGSLTAREGAVMDLTEPHFRDVFEFYRGASDAVPADWYASGFGPPENQNAPRGAARSFHAGRREVFKGSLAMGFCDAVRFPCGYVTVLRDPMERLFSHHAYSCAAGAENRAGWTPEMRAA